MSLDEVVLGVCQVCNRDPAVGVASIPGVPMSVAWCSACLRAEIVPVWVCEFWRDMAEGDPTALAEWAHHYINDTLAYFAIVIDELEREVWWAAWKPIEGPPDEQ